MTKPAENCKFSHICWRNLLWKTSFFVSVIYCSYFHHMKKHLCDMKIYQNQVCSSEWTNSCTALLSLSRVSLASQKPHRLPFFLCSLVSVSKFFSVIEFLDLKVFLVPKVPQRCYLENRKCWKTLMFLHYDFLTLHLRFLKKVSFLTHIDTAQKMKFSIRDSSVNMTKSSFSCGFGCTYWRNP